VKTPLFLFENNFALNRRGYIFMLSKGVFSLRILRLLLITSFLLLLYPSLPAHASSLERGLQADYNTWYFNGPDSLTNRDGGSKKFSELLASKQRSVIEEMSNMPGKNSDFPDTSVTGDLDVNTGANLWNSALDKTSQDNHIMSLRMGSTEYKIFIPLGLAYERNSAGETVAVYPNQGVLADTATAVERYKEVVKEGILAGSFSSSFNIYSMYPDDQVPLTDILEPSTDKSGRMQVKTSGVTMNYSLDYFYSPLFGKMDASVTPKSDEEWLKKAPEVKVTAGANGKLDVGLSSDFLKFIMPKSKDRETLTDVQADVVVKADGTKSYKSSLSGQEIATKNMVDIAMRLIVPSKFTKGISSGKYALAADGGYVVIPDTRLLISNYLVYGKKDVTKDTLENLGNYTEFGLDNKSLVLGKTTVGEVKDKDGNVTGIARTVGAVIPLWYKEAVMDAGNNIVYTTGRTVRFGNDYVNKLTFDGKNKDLLSVAIDSGGPLSIALRNYSFASNATYTKVGDHYSLEASPADFKLQIAFDSGKDYKGFAIFMNNAHVSDPDLVLWLESNEARALSTIKAEELYKKITGSLDKGPQAMEYTDWIRMQEIKSELNVGLDKKLMSVVRVITLIFGVFLIAYSTLLVMFYWLDIFNVLVEFSFVNLMTFHRLYPISSQEDLSYITYSKGDVKYVTFWNVFFIFLCGVSIGLVFIFSQPIIDLLLYLYYKIISLVGVV
jgi:hypothetical protein